jgi:hypothetical protein
VVRVRLDRKATSISLLVILGVRADGQKVLLAIKSMGGESAEAWRTALDDLIRRGLQRPEFLIVDGASGLDKAIAAVWDGVPVQRCTVHKHRNLLAHAPERLHEEITADYNDMIYAATREEMEARRKAFIRKWRLKHRAVADSLEEAGERLFAFTRLPPSQWRSVRTTNAIERLHEEFKRRIKTQTVLPSADLLNFGRASRVSSSSSNSLETIRVALSSTQRRQAKGLPSGERTALISTLVSITTRSTLIGHEPLELRVGQAALGRFPLDQRDGPAQTRLGLATYAVLLFQPIEFGWRQHDGHRLAFLQNCHRFVPDGLNQLPELDLPGIVRQRSHRSTPLQRQ